MNKEIRRDILSILERGFAALSRSDLLEFTELSNHINHNASIFQDEDSLTIATVIYSLGKLFFREEKIDEQLIGHLRKAQLHLTQDNVKSYRKHIRILLDQIRKRDESMSFYITHILDKAGIKKGTKLYYNGISLGRVAHLMGLSQWELINYLGKTNIVDTFEKTPRMKERLAHTRRIFS